MRLYLIRHAESENNALFAGHENVSGRKPDPDLTETGYQQAQLVARHLSQPGTEPRQHPYDSNNSPNYGFTHLYCSLMTRSLVTAEHIAKDCGLVLHARSDLFERLGIYEYDDEGNLRGLPGPGRKYFESRFPEVVLPEELSEQGWWNRPVESDADFFSRTRSSLQSIIQMHGHSTDSVGMVVHGDYIDQCFNALLNIERMPENYSDAWVANCATHNTSISRIDIVNGSRTVVYLNRIDHLPNNLITW